MIQIDMCSKQHQLSSTVLSPTLTFCNYTQSQGGFEKTAEKYSLPNPKLQLLQDTGFFEVADLLLFYCDGWMSAPASRGSAAPWCHAGAVSAVASPIRSERPSGKLKYVREKTCWQIDGERWRISVNHNTKGVNQDQAECPSSWEVTSHLSWLVV